MFGKNPLVSCLCLPWNQSARHLISILVINNVIHVERVKNASLFKVTQGERPSLLGLTDSSKVALNIDVMYLRQQQCLTDAFNLTKVAYLMSKVNSVIWICFPVRIISFHSTYEMCLANRVWTLSVKFKTMGVRNESCFSKAMHNWLLDEEAHIQTLKSDHFLRFMMAVTSSDALTFARLWSRWPSDIALCTTGNHKDLVPLSNWALEMELELIWTCITWTGCQWIILGWSGQTGFTGWEKTSDMTLLVWLHCDVPTHCWCLRHWDYSSCPVMLAPLYFLGTDWGHLYCWYGVSRFACLM